MQGFVICRKDHGLWFQFTAGKYSHSCFFCKLFTTFSYAGLSAAFPKSGGKYEYTKKAFGKTMGLITGAMNGIKRCYRFCWLCRVFCWIDTATLTFRTFWNYWIDLFCERFGNPPVVHRQYIIECGGLLLVIFSALPDFAIPIISKRRIKEWQAFLPELLWLFMRL